MTPHLVAGYFGADPDYARMARVLAYSAGLFCPHWTRRVGAVEPRPFAVGPQWRASHLANTQKIDHWCATVEALPDGARVALLDIDTLITGPLDDVWDLAFDVAYTTKAETRVPFNTGVVFVRVSPVSRAFLRLWRDRQVAMLADGRGPVTAAWRRLMVGLNQAALAATLDDLRVDPTIEVPAVLVARMEPSWLQLRRLPCREWNCEDASWSAADETTRIVHLKGHLRAVAFGRAAAYDPSQAALAAMWAGTERWAMHGQPA